MCFLMSDILQESVLFLAIFNLNITRDCLGIIIHIQETTASVCNGISLDFLINTIEYAITLDLFSL